MRISKSERTRQYIIEKAAPLFNKKGCADTSLLDIIAVTGLTKGAIYGNFDNKDELAIRVFEYNLGLTKQGLASAMQPHNNAIDKLYAFTGFYRKRFEAVAAHGGCAILNSATEADDNFPELKLKVKASINNWKLELMRLIAEGKKEKTVRNKVDEEKYAVLIIALIEGGIMLAKITDNRSHLDVALDKIEEMIKTELSV